MPKDKLTRSVRPPIAGDPKWRWAVEDSGVLMASGFADRAGTARACADGVITVIRVCSTPAEAPQFTHVRVTPEGMLERPEEGEVE